MADEHGCIGIAPYWEYRGGFFNAKGVPIPEAITVFPDEQYQAPLSWAETAYPRLTYFNEVDNGGHFAAWEQPELFSQEIRAAFRSLRLGLIVARPTWHARAGARDEGQEMMGQAQPAWDHAHRSPSQDLSVGDREIIQAVST